MNNTIANINDNTMAFERMQFDWAPQGPLRSVHAPPGVHPDPPDLPHGAGGAAEREIGGAFEVEKADVHIRHRQLRRAHEAPPLREQRAVLGDEGMSAATRRYSFRSVFMRSPGAAILPRQPHSTPDPPTGDPASPRRFGQSPSPFSVLSFRTRTPRSRRPRHAGSCRGPCSPHGARHGRRSRCS